MLKGIVITVIQVACVILGAWVSARLFGGTVTWADIGVNLAFFALLMHNLEKDDEPR